jgi:hypothetical protein
MRTTLSTSTAVSQIRDLWPAVKLFLMRKPKARKWKSPLDRCQWYNAPARRTAKFSRIAELLKDQEDISLMGHSRIFFKDGTSLGTDPTGAIVSNGGMATRAKFAHRLL